MFHLWKVTWIKCNSLCIVIELVLFRYYNLVAPVIASLAVWCKTCLCSMCSIADLIDCDWWLVGYWRSARPVDSPSAAENCLVIVCRWVAAGTCSIWPDTPGCWSASWLHRQRWGRPTRAGCWRRGSLSRSTRGAVGVSGAVSRCRWRSVQGTCLADFHHWCIACLPQQVTYLLLSFTSWLLSRCVLLLLLLVPFHVVFSVVCV